MSRNSSSRLGSGGGGAPSPPASASALARRASAPLPRAWALRRPASALRLRRCCRRGAAALRRRRCGARRGRRRLARGRRGAGGFAGGRGLGAAAAPSRPAWPRLSSRSSASCWFFSSSSFCRSATFFSRSVTARLRFLQRALARRGVVVARGREARRRRLRRLGSSTGAAGPRRRRLRRFGLRLDRAGDLALARRGLGARRHRGETAAVLVEFGPCAPAPGGSPLRASTLPTLSDRDVEDRPARTRLMFSRMNASWLARKIAISIWFRSRPAGRFCARDRAERVAALHFIAHSRRRGFCRLSPPGLSAGFCGRCRWRISATGAASARARALAPAAPRGGGVVYGRAGPAGAAACGFGSPRAAAPAARRRGRLRRRGGDRLLAPWYSGGSSRKVYSRTSRPPVHAARPAYRGTAR